MLSPRSSRNRAELTNRQGPVRGGQRVVTAGAPTAEPPALILRVDGTPDVGDVRRWSGSAWVAAAPSDAKIDSFGLVVAVETASYLLALWGLTWLDPLELPLDAHTDYWLATGGALTATKPASGGILILRHYENGFIVVRSGSGGAAVIDDLDDVDAATPDDGQALGWDATAERWVPLDAPALAGGNKVKGDATDPLPGYLTDKVDGATIEHDGVTYRMRVKDSGITNAKLANQPSASVLGRSASTAGPVAPIYASTPDKVLMERSGMLGFYTILNANIAIDTITGDKLAAETITAREITNATITNAEISAAAAISWSKIDKSLAVPSDVGAQPQSADLYSLADAWAIGWVRHSTGDSYAIYATIPWTDIDTRPTTLGGYGITDAVSSGDARLSDARTPTGGSVTNHSVAAGANIAWTKINKTGASLSDFVLGTPTNAHTFAWYNLDADVWTYFDFWSPSAVTGWISCYDSAVGNTNAQMAGVMAGTAYSVLGRASGTDGLPAALPAATGTLLARKTGDVGFLYDVTLGNSSNGGKITVRSTALADAIVIDAALVTAAGRRLSVREIDVCDSGVAKKMLVLASAPY